MKRMSIFRFMMGASVFLQAVIGIALVVFGIYGESNFYTGIEGFFLHFFAVPGIVMLLCLLHFLAYKNYKKKFEFVTTSGYIAFIVCVTGEILVVMYNMFPENLLSYIVWLALAAAVTALLVMGLNMLYMLGDKGAKKQEEIVENCEQ